MAKLFDRAGMSVTGAPGTGVITLNAGLPDSVNGDLLSFANAGVASGDVLNYLVVDGNSWEIGNGTYSSTSGTGSTPGLTRTTVVKTWNGTATGSTALTLTTAAKVYCVPASSIGNQWNQTQTFGANPSLAFVNDFCVIAHPSMGIGNSYGGAGLASTKSLNWSNSSPGVSVDVALWRNALNILALAPAGSTTTAPQTFQVYGTTDNGGTPTTNYSRLSIKHAGGTAGATIATEAGGTGTAGPLAINASALNMTVSVPASSGFANAGSWFHNGLNTGDTAYWTYGVANTANNSIGIGFFKGASTAANYSYFGMFSGSSFYFHANGLVGFNGVTSSFPAFKRVTTGIQVRLADDSADASLSAGLFLLGAVADTGMARNAAGVVEINNGTAGTYRDLKLRTLLAQASTTTAPNINFATGVAPTTPNNGDLWFDGSALKIQVAGATQTIGGAISTPDPSLANCSFGGI